MQKIYLDNQKELENLISQGKKLAIFLVNDKNKPISYVSKFEIENIQKNAKKSDILYPGITYINEQYTKPIRLDDIASMCDISKSYLCRLFKELYGIGVTEYVTELRLSYACQLLLETNDSIVLVSSKAGYVDNGYFYKLFKRKYHCTPIEFREKVGLFYFN